MTRPVIEFRGVGLTYPGPPPVTALHPCELSIAQGEYVTVVGPSGSGKSTFLNIAGLLDVPTAGTYLLDGIDTGALSDADRAGLRGRRIGFVFQSFHLLPHRSAMENVLLAMVYNGVARSDRRPRAREALLRVGLGHRLDALPTRLSGGERQRVAIARALVSRPSLLLCDEPTGNLDTATASSVLELLDQLHRDGMTILVITHDPEVAARGQRTIAIRDGVLTEQGVFTERADTPA
ncbi:ABC transporter ATP-binding protein [Streptomyces sp. NPDC049837]|uniref:ABC transporter ATP-binding protein n=1 Tax=Streptomyces sp. NPDC049837 TaxID=3155277 RepID=UPI003445E157